MKQVVAGVDIGGTNTAIGVVDKYGVIASQVNFKTPTSGSFDEYVDTIASNISKLIADDMLLSAVGVGAPSANYYTGRIENAANLCWKGSLPLAEMLCKRLNVRVLVTNDANTATIGEKIFGDAKGEDNFLMITLGTGVGSGSVVNGELVYGCDGFAGEAGHMIVVRGGRKCGCGHKGCLETYCSATGIVATAKEILSNNDTPSLLRNGDITSLKIFDYAQAGDKIALQCFEQTGEILGMAMANIITINAPAKVFIFGGLAKAGNLILEPTRRSFNDNVLHIWRGKIDILPSGLLEKNIAVLGAAALVTVDK